MRHPGCLTLLQAEHAAAGHCGGSARDFKGSPAACLWWLPSGSVRTLSNPDWSLLSPQLQCILYHSQLAPDASLSCISDIIKTARSFNANHGLSGVLVFDGQHFLQYLEGPQQPLWDLLVRIAQDPRHVNFNLQYKGTVPGERLFRSWSMGYALVDDADPLAELGALVGEAALEKLKAMVPTLDIA